MAVTTRLECDGASVSVTSTSNNTTVWGCHSPVILRSAIREGTPSASFASCTTGSTTSLQTADARLPITL